MSAGADNQAGQLAGGLLIGGRAGQVWRSHASACARCSTARLDSPRTLVAVCLTGAPLMKDALAEAWKAAGRAGSR